MNPTDPYAWPTFGTYPEPRHVRVLRAKVTAVEELVLKFKGRDGRIPICQILSAFLDAEESA